MRIAHIGMKGIPAQYGGIEVFVEEISTRLVQRGASVYVYSRQKCNNNLDTYKGVNIVFRPTTKIPILSSGIHSFISAYDIIRNQYDIVHLHGYTSYFTIPILKIFGKRVIITLHGPAWENISYGRLSRLITKIATIIGIEWADCVTSVSLSLITELNKRQKRKIFLTPIGVYPKKPVPPREIVNIYDLEANNYVLFLGRLEKVKRVDWLITGFKKLSTPLKLVIAGDTTDRVYKNYLIELSKNDKKIIFTGYVTGSIKEELLSNCLFFVLPSVAEGMPVALLEAMGYNKVCLVSDIPVHRWLIEDNKTGFLFNRNDYEDFVRKLGNLLTLTLETFVKVGGEAGRIVAERFNWDISTDIIEKLYLEIIKGRKQ